MAGRNQNDVNTSTSEDVHNLSAAPILRVVPVNRFEWYIEPSEITQDQYIVKGGILLTHRELKGFLP